MINKKLVYIICSFTAIAIVGSIFSNNVMADDVNYDVNIAPSILISIPTDTVTLNLNPFVSAFGSTDLAVTVGTNNPTGYTLTMSPSDDTTTNLTRIGGTETIPTLADLSGGYTEQTFTTNKWGYKLSSTNYLPFATSNEITVTDAPSNATTSTVTFATKADTTLVSGVYNLEITFTVVANYVPPAVHTIADGGDMQEISSLADGGCPDTLTTGQAYTLTDSRDGESYKVARLADGKCWMLDNLRLDPTQVDLATLQGNTNASDQTLDYLLNGGGTTSDKYPTAGLGNLTEGNSYSVPRINATYKETINSDASKNYGEGSHMYGVYYNYCAASAGSYCYGDGTSAGTSKDNAGEDICPAGWRMPTGGANTVTTDGKGEYQALYTAYSSNATDFRNALSTPLSGNFRNGSAVNQGSNGAFWSSTRNDDYNMYDLYVNSSNVYPQGGVYRSIGYSVRCLLR